MNEPIIVHNMTGLFKKEILLYSLFDIRLQKPLRVVWFLYFIPLLFLWSFPIIHLFGDFNVYVAAIAFIPAGVLANYMAKPVWGGKPFFAWLRTQIAYLFSNKYYYDWKNVVGLDDYYTDHRIAISRRKDFVAMAKLRKARKHER